MRARKGTPYGSSYSPHEALANSLDNSDNAEDELTPPQRIGAAGFAFLSAVSRSR